MSSSAMGNPSSMNFLVFEHEYRMTRSYALVVDENLFSSTSPPQMDALTDFLDLQLFLHAKIGGYNSSIRCIRRYDMQLKRNDRCRLSRGRYVTKEREPIWSCWMNTTQPSDIQSLVYEEMRGPLIGYTSEFFTNAVTRLARSSASRTADLTLAFVRAEATGPFVPTVDIFRFKDGAQTQISARGGIKTEDLGGVAPAYRCWLQSLLMQADQGSNTDWDGCQPLPIDTDY